jgi:molybdenum cofactor guanylyltransferase
VSTADEIDRSHRGALILCGGGSRRMGRDKASLPFGAETMLARMMRLVAEVVPREHIVLVASAEQELPALPWEATVLRDRVADRGPLPALIDGLASFEGRASVVFVVSCDAPLLQPALVERLFQLLASEAEAEAVVPADGERLQPLLAVYRPRVAEALQVQLTAGTTSLHGALRSLGGRIVEAPIEQLRDADSELRSFMNCNTEEEYQAALTYV